MTPQGAARLIIANYDQERNQAKIEFAIMVLANESYNQGYRDAKNGLPNAVQAENGSEQ
jgi:hypothetical protein